MTANKYALSWAQVKLFVLILLTSGFEVFNFNKESSLSQYIQLLAIDVVFE